MVSLDAAQEAIEWAESCGITLDESQCISLRAGMGERADRKWAAFEVADIGPRQSTGKNETCAAREGHEMFIAGSRLVIHTAHEAKTADESFRRMEEMIDNNSEMRAQVVRFRYGNGDHAVEFKSGARLLYKTRTGGGARGFAGASLLVYDEALYLAAKHVTASLAVLARGKTRAHNPQVWSMSSAALSTSDYMHDARKRALRGNGCEMRTGRAGSGGRLAYVEHTAEVVSLDAKGRIVSNRGTVDLNDRWLWALANPAMNHPDHGISEEFIESEQRFQSSDPEGWARERLGFFDRAIGEGAADQIIPLDIWDRAGIDDGVEIGVQALAWDVSPDRSRASVGWVGRRADGGFHGEIVESKQGTDWVAARLVQYAQGAGQLVVAVGADPGAPGNGLLPDVEAAFTAAGLPFTLVKVSGQAYSAACGDWFDKTSAGLFRHTGPGWLSDAVASAVWRDAGESRVFDRRHGGGDITPLCAVAVALRALQTAPDAPAEFWFA